jgi:hypothetical protein
MYKNKVETNSDWTEKQCQYVTQGSMKLAMIEHGSHHSICKTSSFFGFDALQVYSKFH